MRILSSKANTKGTMIGCEKLSIKATAILASMNKDPETTLLFSFINYFFNCELKISGLSFGILSTYSD